MFAQRPFLVILSLLMMMNAPAGLAGTIAPGLESLLQDLDEDAYIKVLVVLDEQADVRALDLSLRGAKAARPQRHRLVMESLRMVADQSQAGLLNDLAAKSASTEVLGYVSHWLINSVVVTATAEAVREIAARSDVAIVEPDLVTSLIAPVPGDKPLSALADTAALGLTPNILAVGAPRVWEEYGIDGTGTIVGIMDSGVDGTHPAFAARWRGNFAPPAECWIDAGGVGDTSFPVDRDPSGHGTHVMGILTGVAPGDTIGVAPGAHWIGANTIAGGLARLDNAVLASLEFMTDPDGDPSTTDDVPDVVQNSWGVFEAMPGFTDCDSRWWDAIDNCEAAGVVLVWAAGNEGPYPGTLRSPGDRASSPLNCFSVGSTSSVLPHEISEYSSRGPSGCGGVFSTKPELTAPGSRVVSAFPGGGYQTLSGTSMAGPHVAGVVALMRQANPDLDVASIKEILMETAVDLGDPGEENTYGHGFLDAYAAVSAVLQDVGTVTGRVTDQATGIPVPGARVVKAGGYNTTVTDGNGEFSITMSVGAANFLVNGFGYFENGFSTVITPGGTTDHAIILYPRPTALISGTVHGPDGQPVAGAVVKPVDVPAEPGVSGPDGFYSLSLPNGPGFVYDLECSALGLGKGYRSVELIADLEVHFSLPEQSLEDFESGDLLSFPWMTGGSALWTIDPGVSYEGLFSVRSGTIRNDERSELVLDYYVSVDSYLSFWFMVSSEYFYDYLIFYLDDVPLAAWSGEWDWTDYRLAIERGHHTFKWVYRRDVAFFGGQDAVWIDFIELPTTGEELFPGIELDVSTIQASVAAGDTTSVPMTITNVGDWTLDFSIAVGDVLKNRPADSVEGTIEDLKLLPTAGGPDAFGYQWSNDDHGVGPNFDWVDISATGQVSGSGDDTMLGPFALDFEFPFYGQVFDYVRVSTNGFLSFTSIDSAPQNRAIFHWSEPNNFLAVFWDDLNPAAGGTIYHQADPAGGRFIVQFDQVVRKETGTPETFQVILYADGTIVYQYQDVSETGSCTVGIENESGQDGLMVAFEQEGHPANGRAIRFEPPVILAAPDPDQGQIAPGSVMPVNVLFDATTLDPGFHVAVMTVSSTDPANPEILVPLMLTVTEVSAAPDLPSAEPFSFLGAVPNPFNPSTTFKFSLSRAAGVELTLFDVSGRRVQTLVKGPRLAGSHEATWNGRDQGGRDVASGTYFARLTVDGVSRVKSVTLVR